MAENEEADGGIVATLAEVLIFEHEIRDEDAETEDAEHDEDCDENAEVFHDIGLSRDGFYVQCRVCRRQPCSS